MLEKMEDQKKRSFLENKLASRPNTQELQQKNILKYTVAGNLQQNRLALERSKKSVDLAHKLSRRPDPEYLVQHNIMKAGSPLLQANASALDRCKRELALENLLKDRPLPAELVEKEIIPTDLIPTAAPVVASSRRFVVVSPQTLGEDKRKWTGGTASSGGTVGQMARSSSHGGGGGGGGRSPPHGLWAWGQNDRWQMACGNSVNKRVPITIPWRHSVKAISAGEGHVAAITSKGMLFTWGAGQKGQLGLGMRLAKEPTCVETSSLVVSVACSNEFTLFALDTGAAYAMGENMHGCCGWGSVEGRAFIPVLVQLPTGVSIQQVTAGENCSYLLDAKGDVYSTGWNCYGQLGRTLPENAISTGLPGRVELPEECQGGVLQVAAGSQHALCLCQCLTSSKHAVYGFGWNEYGQVGNGAIGGIVPLPVPLQFPFASAAGAQALDVAVQQVACGWGHSCCILANGSLWTWGYGDSGQLGLSTPSELKLSSSSTAQMVQGLTAEAVVDVAAGFCHTLAICASGKGFAWGWCAAGFASSPSAALTEIVKEGLGLGLGDASESSEPALVHTWSWDAESTPHVACGQQNSFVYF